ncbi:MAG: hypothetical protein K8J08_14115, partial [Thermoanaerobaculia bacterium]|nr:hypothetical protein [Thermoanaerobaculia bacterium]
LLRISTGGTGVLPGGAIHPDLVRRLAGEASKSAGHVLNMCVRALDYLPPVDVTFFDFLRGLITADFEMVTDDRHDYRVAVVEAFSRWGIFPGEHDEEAREGVRVLSVDTLRWPGFQKVTIKPKERDQVMEKYDRIVEQLKKYADACLYLTDREELFRETRRQRIILFNQLKSSFEVLPEFAKSLGLDHDSDGKISFEVHSLRRAMRVRLDGRAAPQVFVSLTQSERVPADKESGTSSYTLRGGATLVLDLTEPDVPKYLIVKNIRNAHRRAAAASFQRHVDADPLRKLFFSVDRTEPFAALHELADEGV